MSKTYTRLGVRYGRFQTNGSKLGPGKVHLYVWRKEHKQWVVACDFDNVGAFSGFFGSQLDDGKTPVTCKKCLKGGGDGSHVR